MILYLLLLIITLICITTIIIIFNSLRSNEIDKINEIKTIDYYRNFLNIVGDNDLSNKIKIPIYVINLKSSKKRYDLMKIQEIKHNLKFNFIQAISGDKLENLKIGDFEYNGNIFNYTNDSNITKYELACTLSHLCTMYTSLKNNDKCCLILEDDVSFIPFTITDTSLEKVCNYAPTNWEWISCLSSNCDSEDLYSYKKYIINNCYSTASYIINNSGIKKIMNTLYDYKSNTFNLKKIYSRRNFDNSADVLLPNIINSYSTKYLFICNDYDSNIHSTHLPGHIKNTHSIITKLYKEYKNIKDHNIPKILHIIWIGDKKQPRTLSEWIDNFSKKNTDWKVKLWVDYDINQLNLVNRVQYDKIKEICGKADIASYEILYRFGGMYIDIDTIWLGNKLNPLLLKGALNMSYGTGDTIINGWFSVVKNHPFLKIVIEKIKSQDITKPAWLSVGPILITDVYKDIASYINPNDINFVDIKKIMS